MQIFSSSFIRIAQFSSLLLANSGLIICFSTKDCFVRLSISFNLNNFKSYPILGRTPSIFSNMCFLSSFEHLFSKLKFLILRASLTLVLITTSESFPFCKYQLDILLLPFSINNFKLTNFFFVFFFLLFCIFLFNVFNFISYFCCVFVSFFLYCNI